MAVIQVQQGVATWLPIIMVNTGIGAPRTGILYNQIDVGYKQYTQTAFVPKTLVPTDFRENGDGVYEIYFSVADLSVIGSFLYVVNGNISLPVPAVRQFVGQAFIESSIDFTPGVISLHTNILTGNLVNLQGKAMAGESVSARILQAPAIVGVNPNRGGIGTQIISAKTDVGGFFALEIVWGTVVDIVIPAINYRRTLTVPSNPTEKLFDIP